MARWDNEKVLEFLILYQGEAVLWDTTLRGSKSKSSVTDAWERLLSKFSLPCTVVELKRKRESLMSTYRLYKKKIRDSILSGDKIYKTNWFAFELMDSFLGPTYDKGISNPINTKTPKYPGDGESFVASDCSDTNVENTSTPNTNNNSMIRFKALKRRRDPQLAHARKQMDQAVNMLKLLSERSNNEIDEVDLFCQLLAKKIKKFDETRRENIMHEIDELMHREARANNKHGPSSLSTMGSEAIVPVSPQRQGRKILSKPTVTIISNDIVEQAFSMTQSNQEDEI